MESRDARRLRGSASRGFGVLAVVCATLGLAASAQAYVVRGSMDQVYVTGATPGKKLTLVDKHGDTVQTKTAGALGGIVYRKVIPGGGYRVLAGSEKSRRVKVMTTKSKPPDTSIYDQQIASDGYGYLTTRDGTQLAINVYPPTVPGPPPYPTLIEYSGYGYARPSGGQSSIQAIVGALGFAVVDVNMRGTGCSGGSFDFFEPAQSLDGYDVVETIARQPWVLHNKVGMMGDLLRRHQPAVRRRHAAAEPVGDRAALGARPDADDALSGRHPQHRLRPQLGRGARPTTPRPPSPDGGQAWAYEQIQNGDQICKDNQQLHPQAVDLLAKVRRNSTYKPKVADPLAPLTFVDKIKVPTFIACQWTDEQTGGHCPTLASRVHRHRQEVVHVHQRNPRRLARPRDLQQVVRLPLALRRAAKTEPRPGSDRRRAGRLPGRDGHQRRHPAAGPDPDAARLRLGAGRLRGPAAGPDPVRQRGRRPARLPVSRVRAVVQQVPGSGDEGEVVLPRQRRRDALEAAGGRRCRLVQVEPGGAAADRLHRRHRVRHRRAVDRVPALQLDPEPGRDGGLVCDRAAEVEHHGPRRRGAAGLGALLGARRRPAGDDLRGPPRRQGGLRPGRLAEGRRAQARPREEHQARAGAEPAKARPGADAEGQVREADDPALLPGPRLPAPARRSGSS